MCNAYLHCKWTRQILVGAINILHSANLPKKGMLQLFSLDLGGYRRLD